MVFAGIALINQNQYMPPTNSSSKTTPNITRMAKRLQQRKLRFYIWFVWQAGSGLRIEGAAPWRGDAAQLSKGSSPD